MVEFKKVLLLIVSLTLSLNALGQRVTGVVTDVKTGAPLEGASVYFEGTTYGTVTDQNGNFVLRTRAKISSLLVISFLGYEDALLKAKWQSPMSIKLNTQSESLGEVVLNAKPLFSRKQMLRAFREQFLGRTKAGRKCKILNEEDLEFYYDGDAKQLSASSDRPILVENKYLAYTLRFNIVDFSVDYHSISLDPLNRKQTNYAGTSFFKDISKDKALFQRRRQATYERSAMHLMRIIATEDWESPFFKFYDRGLPTNPISFFTILEAEGGRTVTLKKRLTVVDTDRSQTLLIPKFKNFFIDGFGNMSPPNAIIFSGLMGEQRVGDLLPLDYNLQEIEGE